ncbi:MAG: NAD-dependent epimerase/dehydratase family protein [Acidobacteriia bacterium]|nr:NAD-dependent epimerase/dehydratase family protein [Terriglobia bacterium]
MGRKPAVLVTGISGNLGLRLPAYLSDFEVVGVDFREPLDHGPLTAFEKVDLAEERSCGQLLGIMNRWRPEAVAHLAFVVDPLQTGVLDRQKMWDINVSGTGRVMEAIAEYNRSLGGIHRFIFPSSVSAYGPELPAAVNESAPLQAHTLPYAMHKREADLAVQSRARTMKCQTYILRPSIFTGPTVRNYFMSVLRGNPGGQGWIARKLRERSKRLPLLLPMGRKHLEKKFQFVHVDDIARLIAHIFSRRQKDQPLTILNVAGRGPALTLAECAEIARSKIMRVPGRAFEGWLLNLLWKAGVTDIPPEALPYMLGDFTMDTSRLAGFLGDQYEKVIQYTSKDALVLGVGSGK